MKLKKPLSSLKEKLRLLIYIIIILTLTIGLTSIGLSQELQRKLDHLINQDVSKIMYALKLSNNSQELQLTTVKLSSFSTNGERTELLNVLVEQWSALERGLLSLIELETDQVQLAKLNAHLSSIQLAAKQIPLLAQVTENAQEAETQASRLKLNMGLIEKGFSRAVSNELTKLDQKADGYLSQKNYPKLQKAIDEHRELTDFLHLGMQVFRLAAEVDDNADNKTNNQLQREAMRHFLALKQHPSSSKIAAQLKEDWLSQIHPNLIGSSNLFISSRDSVNSGRIANTHLEIQADAAHQIALFSSKLVEPVKKQVDIEGQHLKDDSNSFVWLIFFAGVLYTFFIWLTNWHFISKGIIQPVIATSNAMQAIANEKQNTPLPQADNLELQQMVSSLETLKSYAAQVKSISEIDGLTGAYNRRFFDHKLKHELKSTSKFNQPISIILFDVDNFKLFNDRYGHVIGDQCLKRISYALKTLPEMQDKIFARYGGEEFIVFLTTTDNQTASDIAEVMREEVIKLAIPHADSLHDELTTISIGVTTSNSEPGITAETLIHQADIALYQAKASGKNCIVSNLEFKAVNNLR